MTEFLQRKLKNFRLSWKMLQRYATTWSGIYILNMHKWSFYIYLYIYMYVTFKICYEKDKKRRKWAKECKKNMSIHSQYKEFLTNSLWSHHTKFITPQTFQQIVAYILGGNRNLSLKYKNYKNENLSKSIWSR